MGETGWQPIATAPEEVKRNEPVLLLVHSITATPGPEEATSSSSYWLPVVGYRTDEGWKAVMTDAGLVPMYWTDIPQPYPPPGLASP
jgi:hypothetical protein